LPGLAGVSDDLGAGWLSLLVGGLRLPVQAYDLTSGCPPGQLEDFGNLALVCGELGSHAVGFGPAAAGAVDQDGLADAGKLGEQFADGQAQAELGKAFVAVRLVGQPVRGRLRSQGG
jgi:hypothetical protein